MTDFFLFPIDNLSAQVLKVYIYIPTYTGLRYIGRHIRILDILLNMTYMKAALGNNVTTFCKIDELVLVRPEKNCLLECV